MYLIVGLGNPENEYKGTRHNIGFDVINKLGHDNNICIKKIKHKAYVGEGILFRKKVILAKPQTYMNLSGESILEIIKYYNILTNKIIVVHDDINIELGEIRIKEQGSAGGHNGIKNIIYKLGTDKFNRIKVGIGAKPKNIILSEYVLGKFSKESFDIMLKGIEKATDVVEIILKESIIKAMNKYNSKRKNRGKNTEVD